MKKKAKKWLAMIVAVLLAMETAPMQNTVFASSDYPVSEEIVGEEISAHEDEKVVAMSEDAEAENEATASFLNAFEDMEGQNNTDNLGEFIQIHYRD